MRTKRTEIPLSTKVEQLLKEAGIIILVCASIVRLSVDRDADERLRPIAALDENDACVRAFEYWEHLAEAELSSHFEECNPTDSKALELRPVSSNSRGGRRLLEHEAVRWSRNRPAPTGLVLALNPEALDDRRR
jgi:hypothetical protein